MSGVRGGRSSGKRGNSRGAKDPYRIHNPAKGEDDRLGKPDYGKRPPARNGA